MNVLDAPRAPARDADLRIGRIAARILDLPTRRAHRLSNTAVSRQSVVLVSVALDGGAVGHGEAATLGGPRWAEESPETIVAVVDGYLAPALSGQPADRFEANGRRMARAAARNFAAKSAIEAALLDAVGRAHDLPATALLGGAVRTRFPAVWALASGDAEAELAEARAHLQARRFRRFKVKLGFLDPLEDLRRLRILRDGLGGDATLIVDANQAWRMADCLWFLPRLAELDVALVEQPLPAGDIAGMAAIAGRSPLPIMLDEAVFTEAQAAAAGAARAGHVLSLKLVKSGGAFAARRVAAIAEAHGLQLYGGCLLESSIGAAAHLATFATLPELHWGTEHFGPLILACDPVAESLRYADHDVHLPAGPGLGVEPDPDAVAEYSRKA